MKAVTGLLVLLVGLMSPVIYAADDPIVPKLQWKQITQPLAKPKPPVRTGEGVELVVDESPVMGPSFAVVKITGLTDSERVVWTVTPEPTKLIERGNEVFFNGPAKEYKVDGLVINFDTRDLYRKKLLVPFGPKPVTPPVTDPPVTDPPTKPIKYYFIIVRDEPATKAYTDFMTATLPQWTELEVAGHKYKDKTVAEAKKMSIPNPTPNTVVTLYDNGTISKIVRDAIPLPSDGAGVLNLPQGVKK